MFKNWLLLKNPQVLFYSHETWWKWLSHVMIIFTKFHEYRTKIVDFLLRANFWKCPVFLPQTLICFNPFPSQLHLGTPISFIIKGDGDFRFFEYYEYFIEQNAVIAENQWAMLINSEQKNFQQNTETNSSLNLGKYLWQTDHYTK